MPVNAFIHLLLIIIGAVIIAYFVWYKTTGTYRCYHCGFCTSSDVEAEAHFGDDSGEPPICVYWGRQSKEERLNDFQQLTIELNGERDENYRLSQENEKLEYMYGDQQASISSRFPGCRSIQDIWNRLDVLRGEVLSAREREQSDEFWKRVCPPNEQSEWIARELREHRQLVMTLAEVYPYISGGKLISFDTTAAGVKSAVDAHYNSKSLYTSETGPITPSERVQAALKGVPVSHVDLTEIREFLMRYVDPNHYYRG